MPVGGSSGSNPFLRLRFSGTRSGSNHGLVDLSRNGAPGWWVSRSRPFSPRRARARIWFAKVLDKVSRDGAMATLKSVMARLDEPLPLGYSAAWNGDGGRGRSGGKFQGWAVSRHGGYKHRQPNAEFNVVPENLVVPVPAERIAETSELCTLCSIAMHSVRLFGPQLGRFCRRIGGRASSANSCRSLPGLAGARVNVLDYNAKRLELAKKPTARKRLCFWEAAILPKRCSM